MSGVWRWRLSSVLRPTLWLALAGLGILLIVLTLWGIPEDTAYFYSGIPVLLGIGALSLVAEYVDSSIGMGYGTMMAPTLVIMGFDPLEIIPAILFSEMVSGLAAGVLHHRAANVDFGPGSRDRRIAALIVVPAAAAAAVSAGFSSTVEAETGDLIIALVILAAGLVVLFGGRVLGAFSWLKVATLSGVAAAAKGLSSGGFGPILTGGQLAIGVPERDAVGITSLTEGLASAAGLAVFVAVEGWAPWRLSGTLTIGAVLAVPAAVWTVRLVPPYLARAAIGGAACFFGVLTLIWVVT